MLKTSERIASVAGMYCQNTRTCEDDISYLWYLVGQGETGFVFRVATEAMQANAAAWDKPKTSPLGWCDDSILGCGQHDQLWQIRDACALLTAMNFLKVVR